MHRNRAPIEELTKPENEKINGTLTPRAWAKLSVLEARAKFYAPGMDPAKVEHPMAGLIHTARQSSGSVRGEHRKDLVEGMKAQGGGAVGLSVTSAPAAPANAQGGEAKKGW